MLLRPVLEDERSQFNAVAHHPMQSWEWGEFKRENNVSIERLGYFEKGKMERAIQIFFHKIPYVGWTIGYYPKGYMPDEEQLAALRQLANKYRAIAIKLEPNVAQPIDRISGHEAVKKFLKENGCVPGRPLFTKYTFILDLTQSEEKLMEKLKAKTRYNVNLAQKKGVQVVENTTLQGMETYIQILEETTTRQGFYAHKPAYFRSMWEKLGDSGLLKIIEAHYEGKVLASWILFISGETLYYPYGSSRSEHRDVMASNLLMWEAIRLGKSLGLRKFDMWGALGPNPDPKHPWNGFHRFKEGYSPELYEFIGTYDLVLQPAQYKLYRIAEDVRWKLLRLKAKLRRR